MGFLSDLRDAIRGPASAPASPPAGGIDGSASLRGTGTYDVNAVGESNYVPALLKVAGVRRTDTDVEIEMRTLVTLVCEPENRYDANAVAVIGDGGRKLAYLCREDAADCCEALSRWPVPATCWAEIGGSHRSDGWVIGVRLDLDFAQFEASA